MDRPTLQQLAYAVAVADEGHFGRAAIACAVSQPGLSAQIKELERRLGVSLFERGRRGVLVTDAGVELIERARQILRQVDDLASEAERFQGEFVGRVTLGIIPTAAPYLLLDVVDALRRLHPHAELDFRERQTGALLDSLRRGEIDVGLLALPFDQAGFEVAPLLEDEFRLALPQDHPLARGEGSLPFDVLAGLPLLLLEDGHCLRDQALEACRVSRVVNEGHTVQGATLTTLCRLVAAGLGVTLLPTSAVALEARSGSGIALRRFRAPAPSRRLVLAWRERSPFSADFARLAQLIRPVG